ncbi:MAG: thioredoxin [bacterium]
MSASPYIVEVTAANFDDVVIQGSAERPVLVDFWADWCNPCKMLMPVLSKLAEEYAGGFVLAKVNSDDNQELAQQHGVRSLPTVKLFRHGKAVDEFMGAIPEPQIRDFLAPHIAQPSDVFIATAQESLQHGNTEEALKALEQGHTEAPQRSEITLMLAKLLAQTGEADRAEELLASLPANERDSQEVVVLRSGLQFARESVDLPNLSTLKEKVEAHPDDLEARYQLAVKSLGEGQYADAMEALLAIMLKDQEFRDDIGRTTLLKVFDMLGDDPLVTQYRRRMFNALH